MENWPDDRIWAELQKRFAVDGWSVSEGEITDKSITPCAASWPGRCGTGGCSWPGTRRISSRRPAPRASTWRCRTWWCSPRRWSRAARRVVGTGRRLLRRLPEPGLAGHPVLLLDDLDDARRSRPGPVRVAAYSWPSSATSRPRGPRPCPWRRTTPGTSPSASRVLTSARAYGWRWRRGRSARASSADSAAAVPVLVSDSVGARECRRPRAIRAARQAAAGRRAGASDVAISSRMAATRLLPDRDVQPSAPCSRISRSASSS